MFTSHRIQAWKFCGAVDVTRETALLVLLLTLREKCPNTEFFLVRIFPHPDWKTPYLDTFHAVILVSNFSILNVIYTTSIYWFTVNNGNTKAMCEIWSKLNKDTPECLH